MLDHAKLLERANNACQGHLFTYWDDLSDAERSELLLSMKDVPFEDLDQVLSVSEKQNKCVEERLAPPDASVCGSSSQLYQTNPTLLASYRNSALAAIRDGKVAILLLAGGQGTRLGFNRPKGLFSPGLPSGRSLYRIQAEQLLRVAQLVSDTFRTSKPSIPWYIMTSEHTKETTITYFEANDYFGHDSQDIIFFEQCTLPAFDFNGRILLEKKFKLTGAPDGNGSLYSALRKHGLLDDMTRRGIDYLQIYGVDNILVKLPDLSFIGFCLANEVECAAEVVQKMEPSEPIGVVGMVDGRYQVIEYSEISKETAESRCCPTSSEPQSGRLLYGHGSICVHFFSRKFLLTVCQPERLRCLKYHRANKKVTHIDLKTGSQIVPKQPNAIKFERFIFDVFPFAERFAIWEVPRSERFSPLKNGPDALVDCPQTSRAAYLNLHRKYALAAGAKMVYPNSGDTTGATRQDACAEPVIEISPLVSYEGENLEFLNGLELSGINLVELDVETKKPILIRLGSDKES